MEVTRPLIRKFLENKCTREEAEIVYQYLQNNQHVLNGLLEEEEWEAFTANHPIDFNTSETWFHYIQQHKEVKHRKPYLRRWMGLAASILLLLTGSVVIYRISGSSGETAVLQNSGCQQQVQQKDTIQFTNNGVTPVKYTLDDSSVIKLYPNSTITCIQPFAAHARDLQLKGEAVFEVAHDEKKPFTVFTRGFSTTALGTVFRIKAYPDAGSSSVKLLSGKVKVQNLLSGTDALILEPGDECSFSSTDNRLTMHRLQKMQKSSIKKIAKPAEVNGHIKETEDEVWFVNTPLRDALNRISIIYQVSVQYEDEQLAGRKFTGSFLKKDSIANILATISELNNFIVIKDSTHYRLKAE